MSSTDALVHYQVAHGLATITLDSPQNRNALSARLVDELRNALEQSAHDPGARAVVIGHTGPAFCSGADLREAVTVGMAEGTRRLLDLLRAIVEVPKPVIGRIAGSARAGGVGIVGACDIAVAAREATFAFTEVRLALAPAIISLTTQGRLSERAVGRYYLTGEVFDAAEAARIGLITEVTDNLDDALIRYRDSFKRCAPQGLAESKRLATSRTRELFAVQGAELLALSASLFASDEAREGMTAFREKRPPRWAE